MRPLTRRIRQSPESVRSLLRAVALTAVLLPTLAAPAQAAALSFWDETPDAVLREQLLDAMTPQEIIAQTLMVGWLGHDPSEAVMEWIQTTSLGGVKIFGWNGADLVRLVRSLGRMQGVASEHRLGIPLLTATDQEGGWVRHVKGSGGLTTMVTPGNMAIGASDLPYDAYRSGYYIGMELRALGINMNFAPTIDVYVNPAAHVIGPRAFSSDPVRSGVLGVAFYHGLEQARVIATAKHFPGHGNASDDSHGVLPVLEDTYEDLIARDLVPFRFLINEGVPAVLSGHLNFPNVTGDGRPASLSNHFKQKILREELGFRGLIITDDLYMGGAIEYGAGRGWGIDEIVVEALRIGNDMVMLSTTPLRGGSLWRLLLETWDEDLSFRAQVREAAGRVIQLKLDYLKPTDRVPLAPPTEDLDGLMHPEEGRSFFRDQAGRSVTVIRNEAIPYRPAEGERVLLVGKDSDFLRIGAEFLPGADRLRIDSRRFVGVDASSVASLRSRAAAYDTVIFCLSDPNTMELAASLETIDTRVIVFSILTPIYVRELPWVSSVLAVYGWGDDSFRAGYSVLLGLLEPEGRLPVQIGADSR